MNRQENKEGGLEGADWKTRKAINQGRLSLLCHVSIDQQWSQRAVSGSLVDLINRPEQEFTALRAGIVQLRQLPQNGKQKHFIDPLYRKCNERA